jgi:hypothetical protein
MQKRILLSIFSVALVFILTSGIEDDNGIAGRTGSPGEVTCVNGCHSSYALNSGSGSVALTSDIVNNEYVPDQVYNMQLTVSQAGDSLFGLGLEALTSTNANAGTLTVGTGTVVKTATISGVSRRSITHARNGGTGTVDSHTFNFTWKAPATGTGNVTFYFAGVAANNNGRNSLDYVYNGSQTFTEYVVPSGINDVATSVKALSVYPNPVTDKFTFNYTLSDQQNVTAGIYTVGGQLVQTITNDLRSQGANTETVMLDPNIQAGLYVLLINANGKTLSHKLIVQ